MTTNWYGRTIADSNVGRRMGKAGEKDTVIGGHVRCRSGVKHPWVGALNSHLVQGGDETRLVPATWRRVAGGHRPRGRDLRRHEGNMCLWKGHRGRAPLLLWALGPRVEANPWASGLWSLGAWEGADCCCWLRPPLLLRLPLPPPPPWFGAGEE